jgi:hypothetical protein
VAEQADRFEALCRQAFQFLEDDFGCQVTFTECLPAEAMVIYQNQTTAVECYLEIRDGRVYAMLCRLVDGKMPDFAGGQRTANCCDLDAVIKVRAPHLAVEQPFMFPLPIPRLVEALEKYAHAMRECATDVLQGDFQVLDEIDAWKWGRDPRSVKKGLKRD